MIFMGENSEILSKLLQLLTSYKFLSKEKIMGELNISQNNIFKQINYLKKLDIK